MAAMSIGAVHPWTGRSHSGAYSRCKPNVCSISCSSGVGVLRNRRFRRLEAQVAALQDTLQRQRPGMRRPGSFAAGVGHAHSRGTGARPLAPGHLWRLLCARYPAMA